MCEIILCVTQALLNTKKIHKTVAQSPFASNHNADYPIPNWISDRRQLTSPANQRPENFL